MPVCRFSLSLSLSLSLIPSPIRPPPPPLLDNMFYFLVNPSIFSIPQEGQVSEQKQKKSNTALCSEVGFLMSLVHVF